MENILNSKCQKLGLRWALANLGDGAIQLTYNTDFNSHNKQTRKEMIMKGGVMVATYGTLHFHIPS